MDPAEPDFQGDETSCRLDPSDAKFVDVIHTSMFGLFQPVSANLQFVCSFVLSASLLACFSSTIHHTEAPGVSPFPSTHQNIPASRFSDIISSEIRYDVGVKPLGEGPQQGPE